MDQTLIPRRLEHWIFVIAVFLGAAFWRPTDASGQLVRGTLVEQNSSTPIEGAAIVLLDSDDVRVAWTLTDAAGRFHFRLDRAGRFTLRAERIGHASTRSDVFELGAGDTLVYRMEAPVKPIKLVGLTVEGSARDCKIRPAQGVATARVWEEARKALEAAVQTTRRGRYKFVIRRFAREVGKRGRKVLEEASWVEERVQDRPFASLDANSLIEDGFVQLDGDTAIYYAPDAEVLLSDVFLDSHCFRLGTGADRGEGLLGLEFEPTAGREVSEISGTLWIEPASAELQRLEYRYENLGFPIGRAPVGGTLVFAGLPNGAWFVRSWSIRMPNLEQRRLPSASFGGVPQLRLSTRVVGIHEEGALVLRVLDGRGELVVESGSGTIAGAVVMEDGGGPAAGATVSVRNTGKEVTTGDDGLFRVASLGDGTYDVKVTHPSLTLLGHGGTTTSVQAVSGEITSVRLTIPSESRVLEEVCRGPGPEEGGIVLGWTRHAETNEPIRDATVRLTTMRYERVGKQGIQSRRSGVTVRTRDDGFFIYCGTEVGTLIDIDVTADGMEAWNGTVGTLNKGQVARVTIPLSPERKRP